MRLARYLWPWLALLPASVSFAEAPTGEEWLNDCRAYLAVLEGGEGDDLDIAHCTGLTRGILAGLETGARLGAVSMGSTLTVRAGLDEDEVLQTLRRLDAAGLLRYCLPEGYRLGEVMLVVAEFLRVNPGLIARPAATVFFEALQAAHPCPGPAAAGE